MAAETVTDDISLFGQDERETARELLAAYGSAKDRSKFLGDGIKVFFNTESGMVFLSDEDYNTAIMMDGGYLEDFLVSPYEGHEGTFAELRADYYDGMEDEDREWLRELAGAYGVKLAAN